MYNFEKLSYEQSNKCLKKKGIDKKALLIQRVQKLWDKFLEKVSDVRSEKKTEQVGYW